MTRHRDQYLFREAGGFVVDATVKRGGEDIAFQIVPDPELCIVFLQQHAGAPNAALVRPGDEVVEGQKIGDSDETLGVPVHAPIAGVVRKIEDAYHPTAGGPAPAVFIERRDRAQPPVRLPAFDAGRLDELNAETLLAAVREAGVVGLGGAAFPTHVKLAMRRQAARLVINAKESDPNVACDVRLKREHAEEIVAGIQAMTRMLEPEEVVFATRAEPGAFADLEARLAKAGVDMAHIPPSYSVGSDKLLVKELFGLEVPCGAYPPDVGVVVHNVFTAYAVARALFAGEPLVSRGLTLISRATGPLNLWVKVGTPLRDVLRYAGLDPAGYNRLTIASMLMGQSVPDTDVPMLKATAGICAFGPDEPSPYDRPLPCIRCGYCNMVCPVGIYPVLIMEAETRGQTVRLRRLHAEDCIDCGLCSYVCPSAIKLTAPLRRAMAAVKRSEG